MSINLKNRINIKKLPMPIIEPVPYCTADLNFFKRVLKWITYTRKWRLVEDWYFILPYSNENKVTRFILFMVPKGFVFDGASVPKFLRGFLSPVGILFLPGILHDYAYKYNKLIVVAIDGSHHDYKPGAGKCFWDKLFRKVACHVNELYCVDDIAWLALYLFGFVAWHKHRKQDK